MPRMDDATNTNTPTEKPVAQGCLVSLVAIVLSQNNP